MRHSILLSALLGLSTLSSPLFAQNAAPEAAPAGEAEQQPSPAKAGEAKTGETAPKRENRRQQSEMRLRAMMSDLGLEDAPKQDAVIAYLAEDEAGKDKVRAAQRRLSSAVRRDSEPQRIRDLIAVYKATLDADKERRSAAQGALDAKIGFSLDPRVEAVLWLCGVLGDGAFGLPLERPQGRPAPNWNLGPTPGKSRGNGPNGGNRGPKDAEEVCGTVERKGEGWIEVRDEQGTVDRYLTFWTDPAGGNNGYDRTVLEAINTFPVGAPVRLQWVWNEKKRVVNIEALVPAPPQATAPTTSQNAPENPADTNVPQEKTLPQDK